MDSDTAGDQTITGDSFVKINVRGKVFEIDRGCLMQQPGSRLHELAEKYTGDVFYFNRFVDYIVLNVNPLLDFSPCLNSAFVEDDFVCKVS